MSLLFKPVEPAAVAGDFIPFWNNGLYHLFYIKDNRDLDTYGYAMSWFQVVTADFVTFNGWGEAIIHGTIGEQDYKVFTGSVFEYDGVFHIFYTGHNDNFIKEGRPQQAILHAVSHDLRNWHKDREFYFAAPEGSYYEKHDWRDPYVYRDEKTGEFRMLITARKQQGLDNHRGVIAQAVSDDLVHWRLSENFWAPDEYHTHECPDLFKMGDWWYLMFSTYSEKSITHYRMAKQPAGPWLVPADDQLDTRGWYAAKTTANEKNERFAFGWLPIRSEDRYHNPNQGPWHWGGNLVVHQLRQRPDGTLKAVMPAPIAAAFTKEITLQPVPVLGHWQIDGTEFRCQASGRFSLMTLGRLPETAMIEAAIEFSDGVGSCGIMLKAAGDLESYHLVRLDLTEQRISTDFWERRRDRPFAMERPISMRRHQSVSLKIIIDGTCMVVYADNEVALSTRIYPETTGNFGVFASDENATFTIRARHL